jgi:hypothetical protein
MDENVARTHKSLTILTALLDQLRRNGALTDEEVKEIVANPRTWWGRSILPPMITRYAESRGRAIFGICSPQRDQEDCGLQLHLCHRT